MEAILLVGGLGTRLRPLTDHTAKPMLPVGGVPLVVHQITRARAAGVDHVVLATSYRAETFADALGDGSALGIRVDYAVEDEPLGTGGAIRNAADLLDGPAEAPVVVLNGDIIDGNDLAAQAAQLVARGADVSLALTRVSDPRRYGCVPTEGDRVVGFHEKSPEPVTDQINAGCYVFRRSVVDQIPRGVVVSVERETFPALLESGASVLGWCPDSYWRDLGTPADYVAGSADLVLGVVDAPARPGPAGPFLALDGAEVHTGADVRGGTCLAAGSRVAEGAGVVGSVVLDDAIIGAGAQVHASAIGQWAAVGAGAVLDGVVVADGVEVPEGARPAPGSHLT